MTAQNRAARRVAKSLSLRTTGETRGIDADLTEAENSALMGRAPPFSIDSVTCWRIRVRVTTPAMMVWRAGCVESVDTSVPERTYLQSRLSVAPPTHSIAQTFMSMYGSSVTSDSEEDDGGGSNQQERMGQHSLPSNHHL
jgi:hypothetical protein